MDERKGVVDVSRKSTPFSTSTGALTRHPLLLRFLSDLEMADSNVRVAELMLQEAEALWTPQFVLVAIRNSAMTGKLEVKYRARIEPGEGVVQFLTTILTSSFEALSVQLLDSLPYFADVSKHMVVSPATCDPRVLLLLGDRAAEREDTRDFMRAMELLARMKAENLSWSKSVSERVADLAGLHRSAQEMRGKLFQLNDLLSAISQEAAHVVDFQAAAILLPIDETRSGFTVKAQFGFPSDSIPLPNPLFAKAFDDFAGNGQRAVVYHGKDDEKFLAVPVVQRKEAIGMLLFYTSDASYRLTQDRIQVAEIFGDWVSVAIENAFLFERLSNSQKEWENTFDSIADPIYIIDNEYHLKKINKSLAGFAMRDLKLPLDRNCYRYLYHRSSICPWCPVPKSTQIGQPVATEAKLFSGGTWQIQSFAYTDQYDKRIGSINVLRDISVLKRMQDQLIESEKMASTGKLISGVAHEVRNPLFGISATVRALANELGNKEELKPFLDVITSETTRLNRLMEDLLNYSRPVRIDKDASDIGGIVREVIDHFKQMPANSQVEIVLAHSDPIPQIAVDSSKIKQVLINLIENAIQHSGERSRIDVFLEYLSFADPPEIHLVVKDNGVGIPEGNLTRIFDPFFTTRNKGTGLGLSIVRKVVHDHGGRIALESHPGLGTSFRITLPVVSRRDEAESTDR